MYISTLVHLFRLTNAMDAVDKCDVCVPQTHRKYDRRVKLNLGQALAYPM